MAKELRVLTAFAEDNHIRYLQLQGIFLPVMPSVGILIPMYTLSSPQYTYNRRILFKDRELSEKKREKT